MHPYKSIPWNTLLRMGMVTTHGSIGRWIKINTGLHTPLRVCYSPDLLRIIVKSGTGLQPMDRVGLMNDYFALMRAGA